MAIISLVSGVDGFAPSQPSVSQWTTSRLFSSSNGNTELEKAESSARRKMMEMTTFFAMATVLLPTTIAVAAEETASPEVVAKAFAQVRFELEDPAGGVSVMQKLIDDRDWSSLLDFTKTYDQILRKAKMGSAKKLLPKESKDVATLASNAVTFDLIGINRASRKGQESVELANKYLNELRNDVKQLLDLQKTIQ